MKNTSKITPNSGASTQPIVFFGTEDFSLTSLKKLIETGFEVAAVVTKPSSRRGRGHHLVEPAIKVFARERGIPVWQPVKLIDIIPSIQALTNPVGVLVSYGKIIPQSIIDLFSPGIINVHPSLLPTYRGPSPIESAIAHRDARTGITLMKLGAAMDAGPIYYQVPYALDQTETQPELYTTLAEMGAQILVNQLPLILNNSLAPVPQNDAAATYCTLLKKDDARLDMTKLTPGEAEALIRAHLNFPRSRITIGTQDVIVTRAHGVMTRQTPLDIQCANGAFLSIDELIAPSGKTMSRDAFLHGYRV